MRPLLKGVLTAGALFLWAASAAADEPGANPPDAARVAGLVARLGSPQFAEREAATRELGTLGPAALDSLRRAVEAEDPEVRRRAQKLVRHIEQRLTTDRLLTPTRVRLVCRDMPVTEAVADLSRKTGLRLQIVGKPAGLAQRRLTLDTGDTTCWDGLAQFCKKAGLTDRGLDPTAFQDEDRAESTQLVVLDRTSSGSDPHAPGALLLADGPWQELPTCQAGAVRIRALPPGTATPHVSKGEGERLLVLEVIPEPRLEWQSVLAVRVDRAVDDKGSALKQPAVVGGLGGAVGHGAEETLILWDGAGLLPANPFGDARHAVVRFGPADGLGQRLKELRGTIAARVGAPPEQLAKVDDILRATGKTVRTADGSKLQVVEVGRTDGGQYQVRVALTAPPPELIHGGVPARLLIHKRGWWGQNTGSVSAQESGFSLLDAQGRPFPLANGEAQGILTEGIRHEFTLLYTPLADGAAPARLVHTGRRSVTVEVPFTLRDVPLP